MSIATRRVKRGALLLFGVALPFGLALFFLVQDLRARNDFERRYQAALAKLARDDLFEAYSDLRGLVLEKPTDTGLLLNYARAARQNDRDNDALKALEDFQKHGGDASAAQLERRLLRLQQGAIPRAMSDVQAILQQPGIDLDLTLEALSRGCIVQARLFDALSLIDAWLTKHPTRVRAWALKAEVMSELGFGFALTRNYADKALELNPGHVKGLLLKTIMEAPEPAKARLLLMELHEREPENSHILVALAEACLSGNDFAAADDIAGKLDALQRDAPFTTFLRARIALQRGDTARGEALLARILRKDKSKADVVAAYVDCLRLLGKQSEREQWQAHHENLTRARIKLAGIKESLGKHPDDLDLQCQFGACLLEMDRSTEGLQWLEEVLRHQPQHPEANAALAKFYRARMDFENARKHERVLDSLKKA